MRHVWERVRSHVVLKPKSVGRGVKLQRVGEKFGRPSGTLVTIPRLPRAEARG